MLPIQSQGHPVHLDVGQLVHLHVGHHVGPHVHLHVDHTSYDVVRFSDSLSLGASGLGTWEPDYIRLCVLDGVKNVTDGQGHSRQRIYHHHVLLL